MSRYGATILYRQVYCEWCGAELEHKPVGRDKRFCSPQCHGYWNRANELWARACVDAALAGEPEPRANFGYPRTLGRYRLWSDGHISLEYIVTKDT